jgi:hypothetical protein
MFLSIQGRALQTGFVMAVATIVYIDTLLSSGEATEALRPGPSNVQRRAISISH